MIQSLTTAHKSVIQIKKEETATFLDFMNKSEAQKITGKIRIQSSKLMRSRFTF